MDKYTKDILIQQINNMISQKEDEIRRLKIKLKRITK